ncbi:KRRI-Interacting protein 1 [Ascosphaera acerosa]|nr:KRRI-Interacting protein 1 [Ascosphaera acerosa]
MGDAGEDAAEEEGEEDGEAGRPSKKRKTAKDRLQEKKDAQRAARRERRKIEALVDQSLALEPALLPGSAKSVAAPATSRGASKSKGIGFFRYRATSPISFGLTARDILLAEDKQLNQFAGLKKLAPFRDETAKRRDAKKLGKKARLREWRRDAFGDENGPDDAAFQEMLRRSRREEEGGESSSPSRLPAPARARPRLASTPFAAWWPWWESVMKMEMLLSGGLTWSG